MNTVDDLERLIVAAREARNHAYAPYSRFSVGSALLCENGKIFTGANVENISFGLTICAERVALGCAVAHGERSFRMLAVVADSVEPVSPCGACRQVLAEFAPDLQIISATLTGKRFDSVLGTLLPRAKTGILERERST